MKKILIILLGVICSFQAIGQKIEVTGSRKTVCTSGDILAAALPIAGVTSVLILQDWEGLKQGAFSGATAFAVSYGLKFLIDKERPDKSNNNSFPSFHTASAFTAAAFVQRRYGWNFGIPAYAVAAYIGWSRVYGKKHDWWDVATGAAIGIGSSYLFTRPYLKKHNITLSPVLGNGYTGVYASVRF